MSRAINTGLIILVSLVVQIPLALGIAALLAADASAPSPSTLWPV